MKLSLGIVGLPNVGKSTLFNTLTLNKVPSENYPFCTIDPNVGVVAVYDERLNEINKVQNSERIMPAVIEFVDIAGLIEGAHKGEGLGNKFLSNIREVDAIVQVVREFKNENIVHVNNKVSPISDIQIVNTELILKDFETLEQKIEKSKRMLKTHKEYNQIMQWLENFKQHLSEGKMAFKFAKDKKFSEEIEKIRKEMFLLTDKPIIYLINTDHVSHDLEKVKQNLGLDESEVVMLMDIKLENEIFMLPENERQEYLLEMGVKQTGVQKLTSLSYKILNLISYFTSGPKEVRAWTIYKDENIREAAAAIHNDFKNKFIAAEVISYKDFVDNNGWEESRKVGKVRLEGKEYVVKDGDIIIFKHGA